MTDSPNQDLIEIIKEKSDCITLFRKFWPDHYRSRGNSHCPFHEDRTPSLQISEDFVYCHAERRKWDALDLYQEGTGTDRAGAINCLAKELGIERDSRNDCRSHTLSKAAIRALEARGIVNVVDHIRGIVTSTDGNGRYPASLVVPLTDWSGKLLGKQFLPLAGGEKKFSKNTPAKEVFFRVPGTGPTVVTEGVFDALSIVEAIPGADVCAILSAGTVGKLASLESREIVLFLDNDQTGRAATTRAAEVLKGKCRTVDWSLAPVGKDPNDLLKAGHAGLIRKMVETAANAGTLSAPSLSGDAESIEDPWALARDLFPRVAFPWEVLPEALSESLLQLARACATSETPLPGICFALISAALGRLVSVSPKDGWVEPSIIWYADIRESGDGKSPVVKMLSKKIVDRQRKEHRRYDTEVKYFNSLTRQERDEKEPPLKPRGYFFSDTTIEGLRDDLLHHPTGGLVIILDELSAFVSGQNQYKGGKGDDRECWLRLFDGQDSRIGRSKGATFISEPRPSIFGGIQPAVFRKAFTSDEGIFLSDGTIFRFLMTYDRSRHYPLTKESWSDRNRETWEKIFACALSWTDKRIEVAQPPHVLILDRYAQDSFFAWRNSIDEQKILLHPCIRGFIPKSSKYATRLAGIMHCIHAFSRGKEPDRVLSRLDVERGIKAVEFYLGQIVDAMRLIEDEAHKPFDDRVLLLGQVLDELREKVHSGRLAVGFVMDRFNQLAPERQQFKTPHAFGAFLRECQLSVTDAKYDANGRRAVRCLSWGESIESLIKQCLSCLSCLQSKARQQSVDADIEV